MHWRKTQKNEKNTRQKQARDNVIVHLAYYKCYLGHMTQRKLFTYLRPMVCSLGGSTTTVDWALKPGWRTFLRISRPSWQSAHVWQRTCVTKSQVVSICSLCISSSMQLPQQPHDLFIASKLPCFLHQKKTKDRVTRWNATETLVIHMPKTRDTRVPMRQDLSLHGSYKTQRVVHNQEDI